MNMNDTPSTTGANGRTGGGKFARGNKIAKGNPHAKRVARLRTALFKAVLPSDLRDVVSALLAEAKSGDVSAARELMQRLLGPPVELDFIERLGALEQQIAALQKRGDSW